VGDLKEVVANDTPMSVGETYILFLSKDDRPNLPARGAVPRFYVRGIWSGRFKIEQGTVKPAVQSPPGIRAYESAKTDEFIAAIRAELRN
jgi:hypothetical protein